MRKGMLWFPDSLAGKFVLGGAVLLTAFAAAALLRDPKAGADFEHSWWFVVTAAPATGAFLGLLVFGATVPFVAWWIGMRQAGIGFIGCVLRFALIGIIMLAIWSFFASPLGKYVHYALGVMFIVLLPWTIIDVIRTRRLREIKGAGLPEVRR